MADAGGVAPIDEQMAGAHEVPTEKRKAAERFLRDDAQLKRQRGKDDRDVVNALMIGNENVGLTRRDAIEPLHRHVHTGRRENQPRPGTRAPMSGMTFPVDKRRQNRQRAEHDRVNRNGRNEEKDGSPPVEGGNSLEIADSQIERLKDCRHVELAVFSLQSPNLRICESSAITDSEPAVRWESAVRSRR